MAVPWSHESAFSNVSLEIVSVHGTADVLQGWFLRNIAYEVFYGHKIFYFWKYVHNMNIKS